MSSAIRKPSFALPLAGIVFIVHPFLVFCLFQMDREKGPSYTREMVEYALFFPSTVFDFLVRATTHNPAVGGFWGDLVLGSLLNAVAWAFIAAILWRIFDAILERFLPADI